jgi:hypothetical protein
MMTAHSQRKSKYAAQQRATGLLEWLIDFLPGTIPSSAEVAIIDDCDDVHALFDHRSELQKILETEPDALNNTQKDKLAKLDQDIRSSALLLFGASKGTLRRYREGRYDRSHWWWYIDDLVREANLVCNKTKKGVEYAVPEEFMRLPKVAEHRAVYKRKSKTSKQG